MKNDHPAFALLVVQLAIGRYLAIAPADVRPRHRLVEDLRLDAFDVALIAVALGDQLGVEVALEHVDDAATVAALVHYVTRVLVAQDDEDDEDDSPSSRRPMRSREARA